MRRATDSSLVPEPATFVVFDIGALAVLGGRKLIATDRKNSKEIFLDSQPLVAVTSHRFRLALSIRSHLRIVLH